MKFSYYIEQVRKSIASATDEELNELLSIINDEVDYRQEGTLIDWLNKFAREVKHNDC